MKRGGFTMAALGFLGYIGNVMGWSESTMTTKIHEFTEMLGAGNYTGPITVAMIVAGLGIAFRGIANKYNRENREYSKKIILNPFYTEGFFVFLSSMYDSRISKT